MSIAEQNVRSILPEYAVDNLGTSFKVILVNSAECIKGGGRDEILIPDYQGLIKKVAVTRAAHPWKLKGGDIRFLRKTLGLRGKDLAEKLDITPEHLSRCENGDKVLSPNSEKVLRSLILLEAVYVLERAIEDSECENSDLRKQIRKLLESLGEIVSGLKISPVQSSEAILTLHFRRVRREERQAPSGNQSAPKSPEWLDEAA